MKYLMPAILSLFIIAGVSSCKTSKAQENTTGNISSMVDSRNFTFKAETARPIRGGNQQLAGAYDVMIRPDKIVAYLPFFGKAQTIPPGSDGGIRFTSHSFDYNAVRNKKGWGITIKTNDVGTVRQLYFTVHDNGTATLDVMNIHRDDISFSGHIK